MKSYAEFAPVQTLTVGNTKITYLMDGGSLTDASIVYPTSDKKTWKGYDDLLDQEKKLVITHGGFLIEIGDQKILMDLGYGEGMHLEIPDLGLFLGGEYMNSLKKTGISPEEITDVFYTHLHCDHVGWTSRKTDNGYVLNFPNARHWCSKKDWDYWPEDTTGLGPDEESVVGVLKDVIRFVEDGQEIAPGLRAYNAFGHTPGLMLLKLEEAGTTVWFAADIFHCAVQFRNPEWYAMFDVDHVAAAATREKYLPLFAEENTIIAEGHFADSAFGKVVKENGNYVWKPILKDN